MSNFVVQFSYVTYTQTVISAESKEDARIRMAQLLPDAKVDAVYEVQQ